MAESTPQRTLTVAPPILSSTPLLLHLKSPTQTQPQTLEQQKPKPQPPHRRVTWTEDTIDNEHFNNLKSNLCCIYHDPNNESSDTCTSDDEGNALERDRQTKQKHKEKCSKYRKKGRKQESKKGGCCPGHK